MTVQKQITLIEQVDLKIRKVGLMTLNEYNKIRELGTFPDTKVLTLETAREGQKAAWWLRDIDGKDGFIADKYWTSRKYNLTYRANLRPALYIEQPNIWLAPEEVFYINKYKFFMCTTDIAIAITPIANQGYYFQLPKSEEITYENSYAYRTLREWQEKYVTLEIQ